jgi:hypothetical protein
MGAGCSFLTFGYSFFVLVIGLVSNIAVGTRRSGFQGDVSTSCVGNRVIVQAKGPDD